MPDRFRLDIDGGYLAPVEFFQVGNGVFKVGFFMVDPVHYKHNRLVERLDLAELLLFPPPPLVASISITAKSVTPSAEAIFPEKSSDPGQSISVISLFFHSYENTVEKTEYPYSFQLENSRSRYFSLRSCRVVL